MQGTTLWELEVGWKGSRLRSWERRAPRRRAQSPVEKAVLLRVQTGHSNSLSCWQHLQEDRDGLHTTAELLQVRVQSLTHILSMQEEELARKVGPFPGPLWVGGVGLLPDPAELCPRPQHLFLLCLLLFGQDREKPRCYPLPLLPQKPTLSHLPTLCRFNLQIPWSLSSPGSASHC